MSLFMMLGLLAQFCGSLNVMQLCALTIKSESGRKMGLFTDYVINNTTIYNDVLHSEFYTGII